MNGNFKYLNNIIITNLVFIVMDTVTGINCASIYNLCVYV